MQTRWETSRRPLFIKTVWVNGYHHPVLFNDDSVINESKSVHKERRTKSAAMYNWNSSVRDDEKTDDKCLKITTIKLLLAGIRNFKDVSNNKHNHTASSPMITNAEESYTIDVLPKETIKFKDLNNEITFNQLKCNTSKRNNFYNSKSSSFDVPTTFKTRKLLQCDCNDDINNTLSERVMVWLDLAAQSGNDKNLQNLSNNNKKNGKKRGMTAQAYNKANVKVKNNDKRISFDIVDDMKEFVNNPDQSILKGVKLSTTNNNQIVNGKLRINETNNETSIDVEYSQRDKPRTKDTKRRIHIFMPNVPKKIDCDSSLSCKSSSLIRR